MIGCYDFCGHYEWTFQWLAQQAGEQVVREFWDEAIGHDSQQHARALFVAEGIAGMRRYWEHTLEEEAAGYSFRTTPEVARLDMQDCPSKGFLLRNNLHQYPDYCDHCLGWIGPVMRDAGFVVDHEHNHCGQCWWEFRRREDETPASEPGLFSGARDVRLGSHWAPAGQEIDVFRRANSAQEKTVDPAASISPDSPS